MPSSISLALLALVPSVHAWRSPEAIYKTPVEAGGRGQTYVSMTDFPEALNLDGSAYGIGLCLASPPSTRWMISMQG